MTYRRHPERRNNREVTDDSLSRRTFLLGGGATLLLILTQAGCNRERNRETYPVHRNIATTVFWVGEPATPDSVIANDTSAWDEHWAEHYGGVDTPGAVPDFIPKENPFYFALPFGDYDEDGPKSPSELQVVPWYDGTPLREGESILKNRWIKVTHTATDDIERTAYAQWEDVGPTNTDDAGYVFGNKKPQRRSAGLDISPSAARHISLDGQGATSWQFVDDGDVPDGPWTQIVTTSPPSFE